MLITHGNTAKKIMTSGIPVIMLTRFATREVAVVAKNRMHYAVSKSNIRGHHCTIQQK